MLRVYRPFDLICFRAYVSHLEVAAGVNIPPFW
jgi:hypothetical protein